MAKGEMRGVALLGAPSENSAEARSAAAAEAPAPALIKKSGSGDEVAAGDKIDVEKLGKAFQNYKRAILTMHRDMIKKKTDVVAWRHTERSSMALDGLLWTEELWLIVSGGGRSGVMQGRGD